MDGRREQGRGAAIGAWAASALLHGALGVGTYVGASELGGGAGRGSRVQLQWAGMPPPPAAAPARAPDVKPAQEEREREREWTLGVDASAVETATWVGVAPEWAGDAMGRISDVEQGAFALPEGMSDVMTGSAGGVASAPAAGSAGERETARTSVEAAQRAEVAAAREGEEREEARAAAGKIEEQNKAQSAPVRGEREEGGESARGVREGLEESKKDEGGEDAETREAREATKVEGVTELESRGTLREPSAEREERMKESKEGAEREALEVSTAEQAPSAGGVQGQGGSGGGLVVESLEGQVSDKESEATALKDRVKVTPGQPVAAKGLEIKTRRPVFSRYVRVMAAPKNAVVRVRFTREGKVASAELVRSSGWEDVDRPLLDAVYQWTASGKRLLELPEAREGEKPATVSMVFEIVLR